MKSDFIVDYCRRCVPDEESRCCQAENAMVRVPEPLPRKSFFGSIKSISTPIELNPVDIDSVVLSLSQKNTNVKIDL